MASVADNVTLAQARKSANKDWAQYRKWTYVRDNELIVRDDEQNIVAVYQFIVPTKAKQTTFKF